MLGPLHFKGSPSGARGADAVPGHCMGAEGTPRALHMKQSVWHAKPHHVMCSTCWKNCCFEEQLPSANSTGSQLA